MIKIPAITLDQREPLLGMLPQAPTLVSQSPVAMEDLGQAYGFVLYRKKFEQGIKGTLELRQAMDYTIVMVNGRTVARSFAATARTATGSVWMSLGLQPSISWSTISGGSASRSVPRPRGGPTRD